MARKNSSTYLFAFAGFIFAALIGFAAFGPEQAPADPNPIDVEVVSSQSEIDAELLAKALTESGAKLYGAFWCSHCEDQKEMFGNAVQYLNYIESSMPDGRTQTQEAIDAGITSYPTWIFPDGSRQTGLMSFEDLAEGAGIDIETVKADVEGPTIEVIE